MFDIFVCLVFRQVNGDLATKLTELARQQSSDEEETEEEDGQQCKFTSCSRQNIMFRDNSPSSKYYSIDWKHNC